MKYSFIIVEGFEKSKVFIDEVLLNKLPAAVQEALKVADISGIEKTDEEPENPEDGKIYYNTLTKEYRIYNSDTQEWDKFAVVEHVGLPLVTSDFEVQEGYPVIGGETTLDGYKVYSNKFYNFSSAVADGSPLALYFPELTSSDNTSYALSFVGSFLAPSDVSEFSFTLYNNVHLDDASSEITIEAGHTYEFNILNKVCRLTDITVSSESSVTPST